MKNRNRLFSPFFVRCFFTHDWVPMHFGTEFKVGTEFRRAALRQEPRARRNRRARRRGPLLLRRGGDGHEARFSGRRPPAEWRSARRRHGREAAVRRGALDRQECPGRLHVAHLREARPPASAGRAPTQDLCEHCAHDFRENAAREGGQARGRVPAASLADRARANPARAQPARPQEAPGGLTQPRAAAPAPAAAARSATRAGTAARRAPPRAPAPARGRAAAAAPPLRGLERSATGGGGGVSRLGGGGRARAPHAEAATCMRSARERALRGART
jgi:hypothetical protein